MATRLNPYLSFPGSAREAMAFYADVFGGELTMNTFGEFGAEGPEADQIMHARVETPAGLTLMGADTPPGQDHQAGTAFTCSLSGDDADELRGWWDRLSDGGTVTVPLERQMWGDEYGACVDRFGVPWMVNIAGEQA